MSRWSQAERAQRRHHPQFRIAEPAWTAAERARLTTLVDDLTVPSGIGAALGEGDLASAATSLWRARRRVARLTDEREAKRIGRFLQTSQEEFDRAGVVIQDHDGTEYDSGLSLEVLMFRDDPALAREVVVETVRPSIYLLGKRIQMGQVIVGGPENGSGNGNAEEARA